MAAAAWLALVAWWERPRHLRWPRLRNLSCRILPSMRSAARGWSGHGNNNNNDVPPNNNNVIVTSGCSSDGDAGVARVAPWAALWRASQLAPTLPTLTVHCGCGWSSVLFQVLGHAARRFTSSGTMVRSAQQVVVPCQLRVWWLRYIPLETWRTQGTRALKRCATARASRSDRCAHLWENRRH